MINKQFSSAYRRSSFSKTMWSFRWKNLSRNRCNDEKNQCGG